MASEEITKEEIELDVAEPEPSESLPLDKNKTKGLANGSKVNYFAPKVPIYELR